MGRRLERLADCNSVFTSIFLKHMHYTPGLLSGLWQGRMLVRNTPSSFSLTMPSMQTLCKHLRCPRRSASSPLVPLLHPYSCVFANTVAWMSNQTNMLPQAASKMHGSTARRDSMSLRCVFQPYEPDDVWYLAALDEVLADESSMYSAFL